MAKLKRLVVTAEDVTSVLGSDLVIATDGIKKLVYNPLEQIFKVYEKGQLILIHKNQESVLEEFNLL